MEASVLGSCEVPSYPRRSVGVPEPLVLFG